MRVSSTPYGSGVPSGLCIVWLVTCTARPTRDISSPENIPKRISVLQISG
jgi:hypothetical protein